MYIFVFLHLFSETLAKMKRKKSVAYSDIFELLNIKKLTEIFNLFEIFFMLILDNFSNEYWHFNVHYDVVVTGGRGTWGATELPFSQNYLTDVNKITEQTNWRP